MIGPQLPQLVVVDGNGHLRELTEAPGVQVWRDPDGGVLAYCCRAGGRYRVDVPDVASFVLDEEDTKEVCAIPHPRATPDAIRESYTRAVLPLVLQALGTQVLHASGVLTARGVVAVCGDSGVGKSTVAFGLWLRGHPVWADDAVAVEISPDAVTALPLPFTIRLRPTSASYFDRDGHGLSARWAPERLGPGGAEPTRLAALCVLRRAAGVHRVDIERLQPALAFPALLTHAYCFSLRDPRTKRQMIERYLELARRVPVHQIAFEGSLEALPAILDGVERTIHSGLTSQA